MKTVCAAYHHHHASATLVQRNRNQNKKKTKDEEHIKAKEEAKDKEEVNEKCIELNSIDFWRFAFETILIADNGQRGRGVCDEC